MKNLKKLLAVLLTVAMLAGAVTVPAFAATAPEQLGAIGMLKGETEEGLTPEYLAQILTRMQVAILYARLVGIEEDAYDFEEWDEYENFQDYDDRTSAPEQNMLAFFFDDPSWGFIGTGEDFFEPASSATNKQLVKILLTAMGYPYGGDYNWSNILTFARTVGIDAGSSEVPVSMSAVAEYIVMALEGVMSDGEIFAQYLIDEGILDEDDVIAAGICLTGNCDPETPDGPTDLPAVYEAISVDAYNFAEIEVTMNYAIDPDSVDKGNIRVNGTKLSGDDKAYIVDDYGEKAVLRVYMDSGFVNAQNETVEFSLTGLKTVGGDVTMTPIVQDVLFRDTTAPAIEKVVPKGNSRLDIYLTEPIDPSGQFNSLSKYRINGRSFSATVPEYNNDADKNTGRIITIKKINTVLAAGEYELSIDGTGDSIFDIAGINMGYVTALFTIVDDKEGPIAEEVLSPVYPAEIKIKFSKEITEDATIYWNDGNRKRTSKEASIDEDDETIATFAFEGNDYLKYVATTIYIQDCVDYWGNALQDPTSFVVTPVPDNVRPEIADYGSDGAGEFWVKFTKDMDPVPGDYVIRNSDGDRVYDVIATQKDGDAKTFEFKEGAGADADKLDADVYSITLSNFYDTAKPDKNNMTQDTFELTIPDEDAPYPEKAWITGSTNPSAATNPTFIATRETIRILFSEEVDSASALNRANYRFVASGRATNLPARANLSLLPGNKVVEITIRDVRVQDYDIYTLTAIQSANIEDNVGNKSDQVQTELIIDTALATYPKTPVVGSVVATSKTKIEVSIVEGDMLSYSQNDFTLTNKSTGRTSPVSIRNASLDGTTKLEFTLSREITADAKYDGAALVLNYAGNDDLQFRSDPGNPPAVPPTDETFKSVDVGDKIEPSVVEVFFGVDSNYTGTSPSALYIIVDEAVVPTAGDVAANWNALFPNLIVDKATVAQGSSPSGATTVRAWNVYGQWLNGGDDYAIVIDFFPSTFFFNSLDVTATYNGAGLRDANGNDMKYFSETTSVRYRPPTP